VRRERTEEVAEQAAVNAEEQLLDLLLPAPPPRPVAEGEDAAEAARKAREQFRATREKLRRQLRGGELDEREVEVELRDRNPTLQILGTQGVEEMDINVKDLLPGIFGGRTRKQRMPLMEAREALRREEQARLVDPELVSRQAVERVESTGIVFIDEIDKIAGREGGRGPDVSREGVQRDILPIVEGTTVSTKHGPVRTDHILFVAAGAFHVSKPSDLIPELQGRFPIRVELEPLTQDDLVRILTEPRGALTSQYQALLSTEGIDVQFTPEAIHEMARFAMQVNEATENIGARRLATILETVLDEVSFEGPNLGDRHVRIDAPEVEQRLSGLAADRDLSRFIL
jgi:ATP-dependent HslUV protease ATP-binding subunit HslU